VTVPRHEIFEPSEVGTYHCISRCVRRAFLCGFDKFSGNSYEHRRAWARDRLSFLLEVFAIELISYAVMANHLHTLIRNRPDLAETWSPEEVVSRWQRLFSTKADQKEIKSIASNKQLVSIYRERLSSISWFNRCVCEYIARRANHEDKCTGRFWEGRFKSQRVHDLPGLLSCSVYVDLNPVRAGVARTPEDSDYTSIQDRIRQRRKHSARTPPLISIADATGGEVSADEYLHLVDVTGRLLVAGKGNIPEELAPILVRLKINPRRWLDTTGSYRHRFKRVIGSAEALFKAARGSGKNWFQGIAAARMAFSC